MLRRLDHTYTRRLAVVLVATLGLLMVGGPGPADSAEEELTAAALGLSVDAGFDAMVVNRASIPVTVTMAPERPFQGQLRLVASHQGGQQIVTQEVEVPGGSTKVFRFVLPAAHSLEVQAADADGEGVQIAVPVRQTDRFLVGLLDATADPSAPPVRAVATDHQGTYVGVASDWLEQAGALTSLSVLLATPEQLEGLSPAARRAVAAAVVAGLDLVVVAEQPGPVDLMALGLPGSPVDEVVPDDGLRDALAVSPTADAWALEAADVLDGGPAVPVAAASRYGAGRIAVSGVTLGAGELGGSGDYWGHLFEPSARVGGSIPAEFQELGTSIAAESLRPESLTVPPIGWIVLFLIAYVLVVGPVNGFVLSRANRPELAWMTVPAVTIVFTVGAWVASADQSPTVGLAGRAAYWIDGYGSEVTVAAVRAPRPGRHDVTLEGGDWHVTSGGFGVPARIRDDGDEVSIELELEALQVGTVVGERAAPEAPPLAITAQVVGDEITVEVTNHSPLDVENAMVRAGTASDRLGTVAAGATEQHTFRVGSTLPVNQQWHDPFGGIRGLDGDVSAPRSLEALLRFGALDGAPGVVWVTGTFGAGTEELPVMTAGSRPAGQGSFVAVGVTPRLTDDVVSPFEIDRQLLTSTIGHGNRIGPLAIEGQTEAVLRFRLPASGTVTELTSSLERGELGRQGIGHTCQGTEVVGENGRQMREVCAPDHIISVAEDMCPEDAQHCAVEDTTWVVCGDDGCTDSPLPPELQDALAGAEAGRSGLEMYDAEARRWIPVVEAFDGAATASPERFVSPLGEVFVRIEGDLFPFDYSGRGIAARYGS